MTDYAELIEWLHKAALQAHELPTQGDLRRQDIRSMAADAIAALIAERDALREALKPFAQEANQWPEDGIPDSWRICKSKSTPITVGDCRRARDALKQEEGGK